MSTEDVIWEPSAALLEHNTLTSYMRWLADHRGLEFSDYAALWRWSTDELDAFWATVWDYCDVAGRPAARPLLSMERMPGAVWCPGQTLNYAEHLLRRADDARGPALIHVSEDGDAHPTSWAQLRADAGALAARLRALGVGPGDRVVAYLSNTVEPVIGLIACASLGAVWNVCGPDFGVGAVVSRFAQLEPKVLLATTGYRFGGKDRDQRQAVEEIVSSLPSLECVVMVDGLGDHRMPNLDPPMETWDQALAAREALEFAQLPFEHPLWVLFSSGTTGTPKGIMQSHGGILLEHLKALEIQGDVRAGDRCLIIASTSWMVWNVLVAGMLVGATPVLLDGNSIYPDLGKVWRVADNVGATMVGVGAGFLHACEKAGLRPRDEVGLQALRCVMSTGSPLSPAGYRWVYDAVGEQVLLSSQSGGTDICGSFVGACPLLPVRTGRIQARMLGVAVAAWDEHGNELINERGELVVTRPMPSMPLRLWGDASGQRLHDSYFATYAGVWRHGDFIEFDADGSSVIGGRSDATLNRNGIRMGSADIYQAVEALPNVVEALVVGIERGASGYYMPLFAQLVDGADEPTARSEIIAAIRHDLSPRHVPDEILFVPGIPHTRTGKKLEVPIKRLLQGTPVAEVADPGAVDHPEFLAFFLPAG